MNIPKHTRLVRCSATGLDGGMIRRSFRSLPSLLSVIAALSVCAPSGEAQEAAAPGVAKPVPTVPVVVEKKTTVATSLNKDIVELSPFKVNAEKDHGFMAANAGTATRLSLDMKDVPAPYSVMTRDFIDALGLTTVQQATMWAVNGGPVPDRHGADTFRIRTLVQVRGGNLANGGRRGGPGPTPTH